MKATEKLLDSEESFSNFLEGNKEKLKILDHFGNSIEGICSVFNRILEIIEKNKLFAVEMPDDMLNFQFDPEIAVDFVSKLGSIRGFTVKRLENSFNIHISFQS